MSARCASVSTFCTRVGFPPSPRSDSRGGVAGGGGDTLLDPVHDRAGLTAHEPVRSRSRRGSGTWSIPARLRSAAASSMISRTEMCTTITAWRAPAIAAASTAPSRTRCGDRASRTLSLALAGSPSVPLATTTGARRAATAASFRAVGKAAPPRPVSPDRSTSSISASRRGRSRLGDGAGP